MSTPEPFPPGPPEEPPVYTNLTKMVSEKTVTENGDTVIVTKRVEMTDQEQADFLADQQAGQAEILQAKRDRLLAIQKQKAIEALVAPDKAQIDNMNEAALDAALEAGGL